MPNVSGNAALDVLIGLFFLFFLLSIVCSAVNEAIAAVFRMRSRNLEKGIRNLLDSPANVTAFYEHWRVGALIKPRGRLIRMTRKPSYIPPRVFALTVLDTFAPPVAGTRSNDLIGRAKKAVAEGGAATGHPTVQGILEDALLEARTDIDKFRAVLERSFDEVMDRVSGWYKRKVQLFLFVIALGLVGIVNADSGAIAQRLWKDDALRAVVVAQANKAVQGQDAQTACAEPTDSAGDVAAKCVDAVEKLGLPIGWSHETSPHNIFWDGFGKVFGLLVTAFALTLGAPFWFDLLGRAARLRGAGPTMERKTTDTQPAPTVIEVRTAPAEPAG